jgi:hypothetical protein
MNTLYISLCYWKQLSLLCLVQCAIRNYSVCLCLILSRIFLTLELGCKAVSPYIDILMSISTSATVLAFQSPDIASGTTSKARQFSLLFYSHPLLWLTILLCSLSLCISILILNDSSKNGSLCRSSCLDNVYRVCLQMWLFLNRMAVDFTFRFS